MTYPGGKAGAGVAQKIINLMPPHQVYIEPFLGNASVMRAKRPASVNIGLDLDPRSPGLAWLATLAGKGDSGSAQLLAHTPLRERADGRERCECGCAYPDRWPSTLARSGAAAGEIVTSVDDRRLSPDPALKASTSTSFISGDATRQGSSLAGPDGTRASSVLAIGSAAGRPDDSPEAAVHDRVSPEAVVRSSASDMTMAEALAVSDEGVPSPKTARSAAITWRGEAADGVEFLRAYPFTGRELVYCDPPYLMSTRSGRRLYAWEMDVDQHRQLLRVVMALPCPVMVSGYESSLYAAMLRGWNSIRYEAMTRGGHTATEWLWYNYPTPVELHDYQYLGEGFRERERIKRLKGRWTARLRNMPALQRQALLAAIADIGISGDADRHGVSGEGSSLITALAEAQTSLVEHEQAKEVLSDKS